MPCQRLHSPRPRLKPGTSHPHSKCQGQGPADTLKSHQLAKEPGRRPQVRVFASLALPENLTAGGVCRGQLKLAGSGQELACRQTASRSPARLTDPNTWRLQGWSRPPPLSPAGHRAQGDRPGEPTWLAARVPNPECRQARVPEPPRLEVVLGQLLSCQRQDTAEGHELSSAASFQQLGKQVQSPRGAWLHSWAPPRPRRAPARPFAPLPQPWRGKPQRWPWAAPAPCLPLPHSSHVAVASGPWISSPCTVGADGAAPSVEGSAQSSSGRGPQHLPPRWGRHELISQCLVKHFEALSGIIMNIIVLFIDSRGVRQEPGDLCPASSITSQR